MKNSLVSIFVLLILTGAIISFSKDNLGDKLLKFITNIKTNIDTVGKVSVPTTTSAAGKSIELCAQKQGVWYPEEKLCEANQLSEVDCKAQGGEFNECASACRHDQKAEMCTLQCVLTCTFK